VQFLHSQGVHFLHSPEGQILQAGPPECKFFCLAFVRFLLPGQSAKNANWRTGNICIQEKGLNLSLFLSAIIAFGSSV
jgi:hypothetical protein